MRLIHSDRTAIQRSCIGPIHVSKASWGSADGGSSFMQLQMSTIIIGGLLLIYLDKLHFTGGGLE